ncbi:MAG: 1-deoxy-D-xylulose-5-phosphate reductoisomerase [Fibrobacteraceae bacterium]|nr:1-deoxy-D-xylulose-5-phosphate reductoisomerase [Fibrobacteraceae bacterium]
MKQVCLLGATGSIGTSAIGVLKQHPDRFKLYAVAANKNWKNVAEIARTMKVERFCMFDERAAGELSRELNMEVLTGMDGLCELVKDPKVDIVLNSLMGAVGCLPTLSAIRASKHIALANKETMVMAGEIIWKALSENPKAVITPVDSEHNAIFQCLAGRPNSEVENLQITASGGPFRELPIEKFKDIRVEDALNHPVWSMGRKITIDSASMMNKGLEVIEAHFLFHMPYEQIKVVVHPQSRVHSLVQFKDGSLLAQLGAPDMKIPIQVALTWPERIPLETDRLDLAEFGKLTFFQPDFKKFRCLSLAFEAGKRAGVVTAMMNAANEVLVNAFLEKRIGFMDIPDNLEKIVAKAPDISGKLDLNTVLEADKEARKITESLIR